MRAFQLKEYVGPAGLELVELLPPEPAALAQLERGEIPGKGVVVV